MKPSSSQLKHQPSGAIANLAELARRGQSGELVCTSTAGLVRVHLRGGRIAWATGTRPSPAFGRGLREQAGLSKQQFQALLDECRRFRLPLLETLVERSLVSVAQARAALSQQIHGALAELVTLVGSEQLFLQRDRNWRRYSAELTFELRQFSGITSASRKLEGPSSGVVHNLQAAVDGVSWVELLDDNASEQRAQSERGRTLAELMKLTLLDGARFAMLRNGRGALVGSSLGAGRAMWCRVSAANALGAAVSVLASYGTPESAPSPSLSWADENARPWVCGDGSTPLAQALSDFFGRADELLAAFVVFTDGQMVGIGNGSVSAHHCQGTIRRRAPAFEARAEAFAASPLDSDVDLEELGFRYRSLTTVEENAWCLASELDMPRVSSVWIFVRRAARLQVGWSYLGELTCRLEALSGAASPAG